MYEMREREKKKVKEIQKNSKFTVQQMLIFIQLIVYFLVPSSFVRRSGDSILSKTRRKMRCLI